MERSFGFGLSGLIARVGRGSLGAIVALVSVMGLCGVAEGQCQPGLQNDFGFPGTNRPVYCSTMWDPDGPGPRQAVLVFGGHFLQAGNDYGSCVRTYDPATGEIQRLGNLSPSNEGDLTTPIGAFALGVLPNGDLVAGGSFAGSLFGSREYLVRWDGSTWVNFNPALIAPVYSIATLANGDVIFGGARGSGALLIRWRDGIFTDLTTPFDSPILPVRSISERANGNLVICTRSTDPQGLGEILELTPGGWVSLVGPINRGTSPHAVRVLRNGDLIAVGSNIVVAEGNPGGTSTMVARYNGSGWNRLGPSNDFPVSSGRPAITSIVELSDGRLAVAGAFYEPSSVTSSDIRLWDGTEWNALPDHISVHPGSAGLQNTVFALAELPGGDLVALGSFLTTIAPSATPVYNIARFSGGQWQRVAGGFSNSAGDSVVSRVHALRDGRIYAQGSFTWAGDQPALNAAIFQAGSWSQFPGGSIAGLQDAIALTDGSLVFRGTFTSVGGVSALGLVRWTPEAGFENIGEPEGNTPQIASILALPGGGFIASGSFNSIGGSPATNIASWNAGTWSPLGDGLDAPATQLAIAPAGEIIASGAFAVAGGQSANHIARWNGTTWSAIGNGVPTPLALAAGADGFIYTAHSFDGTSTNLRALVWNGSAWNPGLGDLSGQVTSLTSNEAGDVFFGAVVRPDPTVGTSPLSMLGSAQAGITQRLLFSSRTAELFFRSIRASAGSQVVAGPPFFSTQFFSPSGNQELQPESVIRYTLACPPTCNPDLNRDGNADQGDIDYLINVLAGGDNPTTIDPDFNQDGTTDQGDIDVLLNVIAGGVCP